MDNEDTIWDHISREEQEKMREFARDYRKFLSVAKTERQAARLLLSKAINQGFRSIEDVSSLNPGDKIYYSFRDKSLCLAVIGEKPLADGFRTIGSHLDAPRLDLKQNPLYEESGLALCKTHYYGGLKKYQWVTIPLALHGIVVTTQGKAINISLGEDPSEPVFTVTDLLPHLAKDQMDKKIREAVSGEQLNIIVGNIPCLDKTVKERVKTNLLTILADKYGIAERDFASAELEAVPTGAAREVGFDRGFIGGYAQDDRLCVYTSFRALQEVVRPEYTAVALFVDKEETGSDGATGMKSNLLEDFIAELVTLADGRYNGLAIRRALRRAKALSADVTVAFDPTFPDVTDKLNTAYLGHGLVLSKYSGIGGKYDTSDANPEFIAAVRRIFDDNKIPWQAGEMGKVDQGGGGTIAQYLARYGMEVVDAGPALLSVHSPFELADITDVWAAYRAYKEFFTVRV